MNWSFWKKDTHMASQLLEINKAITGISEKTATSLQQQDELSGQLAKLTRLQYKSGQETQVKLEQLNQGLANVQQWQTEYDAKREYLLDLLLCQLDEIDRASAGLDDQENNAWQPLLQQWSQRMIAAVAELSLYEIDILGKTFEPQVAECVGAVLRVQETDTPVPYEVAEVVRRGFVNSEGRLLRKAQVITYEEA